MPIIIATGSNQGDSLKFLEKAKHRLADKLELVAASRVYQSDPVDYLDQPDFFNQVLEFKTPTDMNLRETFRFMRETEASLGTPKSIYKGPREIDIDLIFWDDIHINEEDIQVPHPRWNERSFVVLPLLELPSSQYFQNLFKFAQEFDAASRPIFASPTGAHES